MSGVELNQLALTVSTHITQDCLQLGHMGGGEDRVPELRDENQIYVQGINNVSTSTNI